MGPARNTAGRRSAIRCAWCRSGQPTPTSPCPRCSCKSAGTSPLLHAGRRHTPVRVSLYTSWLTDTDDIVLDDDLVDRAKELTGLDTKRAVVEEALRTLVGLKEQEAVRGLRGRLR